LKGYGRASSALTVVNAFATGKGAAVGIELWTEARVRVTSDGIRGRIFVRGKELSDFRLIRATLEVMREFIGEEFGIDFEITSEIPLGKGLKSSSAASNALVLAILDAFKMELEPLEVIRLGVEASRKAGVTLTGAFDDAAASLLGGLCITDNKRDELLKREEVEAEPAVLLLPDETLLTEELRGRDFSPIAEYVEEVFLMALRGKWKRALTLNGLLYASFLGHGVEPILAALPYGHAGLSGKGPAFFAITSEPERVAEEWANFGAVEITSLR